MRRKQKQQSQAPANGGVDGGTKKPIALSDFPRSELDDIDERLRNSDNTLLRESIVFGREAFGARNLVLFHEDLLVNALLVLGAMRCGKTAFLTSYSAQRIRRNKGPFVVVDLKGDDEAMHAVRLEAESLGRPFLLYTNVSHFPTRLFNPLDQDHFARLSRSQISQLEMTSLGLDHGQGYGKFFFTMQTLSALTDAIIKPAGGRSDKAWIPKVSRERIKSFVELPRRIREVGKERKDVKNTEALETVVSQMAGIPQLNGVHNCPWFSKEQLKGSIQIADLFQPNDMGVYPVVYFYLRVESDPVTAPITAKLFLNLLKNGLRQFTDFRKQGVIDAPPVEVDVIIDEASYVLDRSLRNLVDQGASMGLRFVFATQDMNQLAAEDPRFAKTIFENIGSKLIFSVRESSWQDEIMKLSGEKTIHHASYTVDGQTFGTGRLTPGNSWDGLYNIRCAPGPRFERNHLIEISDRPNRAIFIPAQGAGTTQLGGYPVAVDIPFLHSKEKYEFIKTLPWPDNTPEMIVASEFLNEWDDLVSEARK